MEFPGGPGGYVGREFAGSFQCVAAAAALVEVEMVSDQIREAKRTEYAGGGESAGVRAGGFTEGVGVKLEGSNP